MGPFTVPSFYWPAPSSIQRGLEWTQLLKRLIVCLFFVCKQIFSFFPLSSSSFYTVQYRRVQYSTVIGQLPRVSTEDRVVSVFETSVCSLFFVSKFSNFFLFHPLFIQYSTEECSTVQLLARDPEYPQRIRVASVFEFCVCLSVCLSDCSLLVSKFSRDPEYPQRIRVASVFIYKIIAVMF